MGAHRLGHCRRTLPNPLPRPSNGSGHRVSYQSILTITLQTITNKHCRSNWIWNFLISFFTPFITGAIDYRYGYVFAACNFLGAVVVYFFLCETRGRSLEEIDTMYIMHVPPRQSTKWVPPQGEDLVTADALHLAPGARGIRKADAAGMEGEQRIDNLPPATAQHGIHDVSGTGYEAEAGGVRGQSVY
jgi:SP family sugar:H+ symporter-like MFS transporter